MSLSVLRVIAGWRSTGVDTCLAKFLPYLTRVLVEIRNPEITLHIVGKCLVRTSIRLYDATFYTFYTERGISAVKLTSPKKLRTNNQA